MAQHKEFLLPDLGEGLTEGQVVSWRVAVGDTIEEDQVVAEVETAKAVVEIPAPFAGEVTKLHAEVGDEVEVGKPLITVALSGADAAAAGAEGNGESGSVLVGYGTDTRGRRRRRGGVGGPAGPAGPAGPPSGAPPARPTAERPLAKPPVRKFAKDRGIDLADVPGTGPEGRITREDVEAYARDAGDGRAAAQEAGAAPSAHRDELVERRALTGVRKTIAEKMATSRREIPEATTWVDCDVTELWRLREALNAEQDDVRVSPLAIIMRACVAALREFPELNARLDAERGEIVLQRFVNLGFAAHTAHGLLVPVIHGAERLSTLQLAAALSRLAAGARERSLSPAELTGGTFTVTNFGSFGVDGANPVINHPEAAVLGVGRISDRPWVHDRQVAVRKVMQLSVAFDHRVCDGGEAAGFLRYLADLVESPTKLLAAL